MACMSAMPWIHSEDAAPSRLCGGHEYTEALKVLELLDAAADTGEAANNDAGTAADKAADATAVGSRQNPMEPQKKRLRTVRRLASC